MRIAPRIEARRFRRLIALGCAAVAVAAPGAEPSLTAQLTLRGNAGVVPGASAYHAGQSNPLLDSSGNFRLMMDDYLSPQWRLQIHNDLGFAEGDLRQAANVSGLPLTFLPADAVGPSDQRRLFDLARVFDRTSRGFAYDRIDRLNLQWTPDWGSVTIGRAAVTWGDGLIFNVEDIFNPFDPLDVERNYKTGDDLLLVETRAGRNTWQFLTVPRRDPTTGDVMERDSSFAIHGRIPVGGTDWTVLAARHYGEWLVGGGRVVNVGGAVWRTDLLVTRLKNGGTAFAAVSNMDYSWTWLGRNCYGFVEGYFNSLGGSTPQRALRNPELVARLERGELFTLGRAYVDGSLQVEFNPLLHGTISTIVDLEGPSVVVLPRLVWNARTDLQVTLGAELGAGAPGTEFGGPFNPAGGPPLRPPQTLFLWVDAWF